MRRRGRGGEARACARHPEAARGHHERARRGRRDKRRGFQAPEQDGAGVHGRGAHAGVHGAHARHAGEFRRTHVHAHLLLVPAVDGAPLDAARRVRRARLRRDG